MAIQNIAPTAALSGSTIDKYIRKVAKPILDRHPVTGMLKAKGRITYNNSGTQITWPVEMRRATPTDHLPEEPIVSSRRAYHKTATLPWRKFYWSERIDKYTKLANRGPEALAKIWDTAVKSGSTAMSIKLGQDFLNIDGNAAANLKKVHGLPSFFSDSGSAQNSKAQMAPNDTYAGLSTAPANYGGTATDFPEHSATYPCTVEGCFWSPIIVDTEYASWPVTTPANGWKETWRCCLDYTSLWLMERQGITPDVWITTPGYFQAIRDTLRAAESIQVNKGADSLAIKLGYDSINVNGIDIVHTQDCPADTCYGIKWDKVELQSMLSQLFETEKDKDGMLQSDILTIDFLGNFRCESPANFIKIYDVS